MSKHTQKYEEQSSREDLRAIYVPYSTQAPIPPPVYYYQPAADPTRIYMVQFFNCMPVTGGALQVIPIVSFVSSLGVSTASVTVGPDLQIQVVGVTSVPTPPGPPVDPSGTQWYRMGRLSGTVNGITGVFAHRIFVPPQAGASPGVAQCGSGTIATGNQVMISGSGLPLIIAAQGYTLSCAGAPSQLYLQKPI